ncbi:MAG: hypothetical protein K5945_09770 [Bacteroidaceae bacterium]|nr:hypothetical protein [Bacteroidaceae bacterium]
MKRYLFALCILLSAIALSANQAKRVYITLDVSGSMSGNKYALANYTTQMIVTLCEEDDEVNMILYGVEKCLSESNAPLTIIQKTKNALRFGHPTSNTSQFDDIIGFNHIYHPSEEKDNWLFVIGDGEWETMDDEYTAEREAFHHIVGGGGLNVCYLQTGRKLSEDNDFTIYARSFGVIDIRKSDTDPKTIKEGCDYFARKILGFSESPLKVRNNGECRITFKSEIALKGFYLVYQSEVRPDRLPKIESATVGGKALHARLKGTPTTTPLRTNLNEITLSGHVYKVGGSSIPAGAEVEVCFDKRVDPSNVLIYPIVNEIGMNSFAVTRIGDKLKQIDSHSFSICRDETKALVHIDLNEESQAALPEELRRRMKVVVKANNKDYPASYRNGGFECEIDLIEDETAYSAECDCPGYFKYVTPITKIVKGDCPPEKPKELEVQERPLSDLGSISFQQLKDEDIAFTLSDSLTNEVLDPTLFDISFEIEHDFMYEEPKVRIENGVVHLELRPRGDWCECLFPKGLRFKMISTPKDEAFQEYGKNYHETDFPFRLTVTKDHPWLSRCLWVIISLAALLLLYLYLSALQRKCRFKKHATITPTYYDYHGNRRESGCIYLRKEGFGAWVARWLLPGDERNTLSFDKPATTLRFVAAESYDVVNIPKDGNIDPETMRITGYNPKKDLHPKDPVRLGNRGKISIAYPNGNDEGYLTFSSGEETDGHFYRIFITLLKAATLIAFGILLYLLTRSFF